MDLATTHNYSFKLTAFGLPLFLLLGFLVSHTKWTIAAEWILGWIILADSYKQLERQFLQLPEDESSIKSTKQNEWENSCAQLFLEEHWSRQTDAIFFFKMKVIC